MEIKAKLEKPYDNKQRCDFIVENNHVKGFVIKETDTALEAWGYTEAEIEQMKKEEIAKLSLTAADVERALYKAFDKDFDDIVTMVRELQPVGVDLKALKIELKANNFYRGNPYVNAIGALLGITPEQLDNFFKTNDYTALLPTESEEI